MPAGFAVNMMRRAGVLLVVMALAAGCAGKKPVVPPAPTPVVRVSQA